jgi:hypothetical protein
MKENTTLDEPLTTKEKVRTIHNPSFDHLDNPAVRVLRITEEDDLTRIDFVVYSRTFSWVNMRSEAFIRPVNTDIQLTMVKVVNIAVAPDKHWFKDRNQALYYTLYFPALPKDVKAIDIIEKEGGVLPHNFRFFNYYGVSLVRIAWEIIKADQN